MPTYEFKHYDEKCQYEWEEVLSIKAHNPETCPKCGGGENIVRLISGGSGRGKVELYGQDLVDHVKADAARIQREASQDANKYSNLLGGDKYHQVQTQLDRRRR